MPSRPHNSQQKYLRVPHPCFVSVGSDNSTPQILFSSPSSSFIRKHQSPARPSFVAAAFRGGRFSPHLPRNADRLIIPLPQTKTRHSERSPRSEESLFAPRVLSRTAESPCRGGFMPPAFSSRLAAVLNFTCRAGLPRASKGIPVYPVRAGSWVSPFSPLSHESQITIPELLSSHESNLPEASQ